MNTLKFGIPFALLVSFSLLAPVHGADLAPAAEERNYDEDWYWGFNIGGGSMKYTDPTVQNDAETLKARPGMRHATLYFDIHFLWPMENRQTAIGVGLGGVTDSYEQGGVKLNIRTSLLTFSALHYFSSNIGDGAFGQAEIGLASADAEAYGSGVTVRSEANNGTGIRLGLGYAFLLSKETRLPFTVLWQRANLKNNSGSNAVLFTVGMLF